MKVKLLKKVRKRYRIERVDKIAINASRFDILRAKNGYPFYKVYDNEDKFGLTTYSLNTINEARDLILERVLIDTLSDFSKHREKSKKVWWNK